MNNKTSEFNPQKEISNLKREIEFLKNVIAEMKRITNMWPVQPPIFGPKGVWLDVPFDGYTAALHNRESRGIRIDAIHHLTTNFDVKSSPELLEALKDLRDYVKETK